MELLDNRWIFKYSKILNTSAGIQTCYSTFVAGGATPSAGTQTEGYDGTSWSTRSDLASVRRHYAGAGTNAAAAFGGNSTPPTILKHQKILQLKHQQLQLKTLTSS